MVANISVTLFFTLPESGSSDIESRAKGEILHPTYLASRSYPMPGSKMQEIQHRLTPLDEIIPPLYNAFIFAFPCPVDRKDKVLSTLSEGWSRMLEERPVLRGEIEYDPSQGVRQGALKVRIPEIQQDSSLVVNDMTVPGHTWKDSYEELKAQGMPPSKLDGKVIAPLVSGVGSTAKVVTAQINLIPGGCLLAFSSSHTFMDASGCALIMASWAKHCRVLQESPEILSLNGREELQQENGHSVLTKRTSRERYEELKNRHDLWHLLGLHATENLNHDCTVPTARDFQHYPAAASPPGSPDSTTCIFRITPTSMRKLKEDATPRSPGWVSSGDALVALLWRSIMRARFPFKDTHNPRESIVSVAVDGRTLLSPPVSPSYIGNVIFCCMTRLSMSVLLSPQTTIAETALAIRRNIDKAKTPQVLEDAISLAAGIPDTSSLKIAFKDFLGAELVTTSWIDLPFYDINFGPILGETGRAEFFRIPNGQFGGICSLQPRQTNGVIDVSILLEVEQMKRLRKDKEFTQYVEFVAE